MYQRRKGRWLLLSIVVMAVLVWVLMVVLTTAAKSSAVHADRKVRTRRQHSLQLSTLAQQNNISTYLWQRIVFYLADVIGFFFFRIDYLVQLSAWTVMFFVIMVRWVFLYIY